jgi:hypothetical protein
MCVVPSHRAQEIEFNLPCDAHNDEEPVLLNSLPIDGTVVQFNGPNFDGKLVSRVRDSPTAAANVQERKLMSNNEYFQGRSRQFQWTVQGRFSRRMRFDEVTTGQEFGRPFRNTPSSKMVKRGLDLLKHKLPETFECDFFSDEPRFEHPLLAGCNHFRVDIPEDVEGVSESDIHGIGDDGNVIEDTTLLDDAAIPSDGVSRRKYFAKNCNLEKYYYEPELLYTFDFYANFFSPMRHRLELTPFFSIDLIPYFNGYPLFMSMARDKNSGQYLWATELWHKRLLDFDETPGRLARFFSGSESGSEAESFAERIVSETCSEGE